MEYPFEIYWPEDGSNDAPGAIRLSVAALVACLDTGLVDGVQFADSEVAPFFKSEKFLRTDPLFGKQEWDVWQNAHAFIHIKPKGALKIAVAKVTSALAESIRLGQLQIINLKTDLYGSVDFDNTWIRTKEFMKWCRERGLDLDDNFSQYVDTENDIFSAALDAADSMRSKEESPEIARENRDRAMQIMDGFPDDLLEGSPARDYCEKLILENFKLREEKHHVRVAERSPGKRERETLLTIIASLMKAAKVPIDDYGKPGKAAGYIEGLTDELGAHVSKRAIEEHLKKIPDALATRMK